MKKAGLLSLVMVATSWVAVGCTSTESTQTPETAQVTTGAEIAAQDQQGSVAVQADTSVQADPIQSAPSEAPEAAQPVQ